MARLATFAKFTPNSKRLPYTGGLLLVWFIAARQLPKAAAIHRSTIP